MKPALDGWSVVLAGFWNRMIFSPSWIARVLFEEPKVEIEVPVGNPLGTPRFTVGDVRLLVTRDRAMLMPTKAEDETLERVEQTALKILDLLPHTPLAAVGINFEFLETEPSADLATQFRFRDAGTLAEGGFETESWGIARRLKRDDFILNFSTVLEDGRVTFSLNFHKEVTDSKAAAIYLKDRVKALHAVAAETIRKYEAHDVPEAPRA